MRSTPIGLLSALVGVVPFLTIAPPAKAGQRTTSSFTIRGTIVTKVGTHPAPAVKLTVFAAEPTDDPDAVQVTLIPESKMPISTDALGRFTLKVLRSSVPEGKKLMLFRFPSLRPLRVDGKPIWIGTNAPFVDLGRIVIE